MDEREQAPPEGREAPLSAWAIVCGGIGLNQISDGRGRGTGMAAGPAGKRSAGHDAPGRRARSGGAPEEAVVSEPGSDTTFLTKEPGRYFLEVDSSNADWSIKIEEER